MTSRLDRIKEKKSRVSRPTHKSIAAANVDLMVRLLVAGRIRGTEGICWACGVAVEGKLQRAHVLAKSHGGSNDPENFFLLCPHCHEEQPDGASREAQEAWLFNAPRWQEWSQRLLDAAREHLARWAARAGKSAELSAWFSLDNIRAAVEAAPDTAGNANGWANRHAAMLRAFQDFCGAAP